MDAYTSLVRHSGNRELFLFLELAILSQSRGCPLHLHVEGLRGTGKTTIIRAARRILPPIKRIKGCLYNCDPDQPHCPEHRHLGKEEIFALGIEEIPMPFLEISASAKIGTVVGTVDLGRITNPTRPEAALLPGTIPQAHRGIVFVDEINRLADTSPELADILLDVMGTKPGRLQIEESGLPRIELPAQVSVWAASNPDEDPGCLEDIRRQLSDRFDFLLEMGRPLESGTVAAVLAREQAGGLEGVPQMDREMQQELQEAARLLPLVEVDERVREVVASLYTKFNLESLRAVEALQYGAKVYIAREGRLLAQVADLVAIAPAALRHRVDPGRLAEILQHLKSLSEQTEKQVAASVVVQKETRREQREKPAVQRGVEDRVGIWQRVREFLSRQMAKILPNLFNRTSGSRTGRRRSRGGGRPGSQPGKSGGTKTQRTQAADPSHTPILSPPHRARPLFEIAAEGSVFPVDKEEENAAEN